MKRILSTTIISIFVCLGIANATPNITGTNGSIAHGNSITISGSSFGTKSPAAPLVWNNFELCTTNANMLTCGFNDEETDGSAAYIKTDRAYGVGTKSAKMVYPANSSLFPRIGNNLGGVVQVYVTFNSYFTRTSGTGSVDPIFKWVRGGANPPYSGVPRFYDTVRLESNQTQGSSDRGYVTASGTTWEQTVNYPVKGNQWDRVEYYYALSSPAGSSNGVFQHWVNFGNNVNLTGQVSRLSSEGSYLIDYVMTPFDGLDSPGNNSYAFWIDNYYVDSTRARIEICNTATWAARTHCEIQIPSAWSTSSITATVNRGSFGQTDNLYLYVVDSNGSVNSSGYSIPSGLEPPTLRLVP